MKKENTKEVLMVGGGVENKENREKLIKTLIIHLNSYLKTKNNPERINILVEIYQEL
ncbi:MULTISPECIES: hypothetical protein [unclassified Campylobacter]|uniref:hypothetical protein n=1 Tax=unclassified Campylobacter TaxID=2593542 RepID=UPI000A82CF57|nr:MULTISPECIES: hypothetical protein [unclassified Campylobacter]